MYKVIILPAAKADIHEAARWYNNKERGLGRRFTFEVREKVNLIRENPKLMAVRYKHTRCAVLKTFPFMLHFSVDEKQ